MKVHELAKQAQVPAHVVRYYSRIGLLKPQHNPENHYREFSEADIHRLHVIRRAQSLGCSLHEIAALLQRLETGQASWGWLQGLVEAKHHEALLAMARLQAQMSQTQQLLNKTAAVRAAPCTLPAVLTWMGAGLSEGEDAPSPVSSVQPRYRSRTTRRMAHERSTGQEPAVTSL